MFPDNLDFLPPQLSTSMKWIAECLTAGRKANLNNTDFTVVRPQGDILFRVKWVEVSLDIQWTTQRLLTQRYEAHPCSKFNFTDFPKMPLLTTAIFYLIILFLNHFPLHPLQCGLQSHRRFSASVPMEHFPVNQIQCRIHSSITTFYHLCYCHLYLCYFHYFCSNNLLVSQDLQSDCLRYLSTYSSPTTCTCPPSSLFFKHTPIQGKTRSKPQVVLIQINIRSCSKY